MAQKYADSSDTVAGKYTSQSLETVMLMPVLSVVLPSPQFQSQKSV